MNFEFSEEQSLFKNSLERMMAETYSFEARQKALKAGAAGVDGWSKLAELGVLGLAVEEAYGGFGGGPAETMIVMEAFGRYLVKEPYLATAILAGSPLRRAGTGQQKQQLFNRVAEGSLKLALAHAERQARYDLNHVATKATRDDDDWIITGSKEGVLYGDQAGLLIVSARTSGAVDDPQGVTLFLIGPGAPGVTIVGYDTHDGGRAADVMLDKVRVDHASILGNIDQASPVILEASDRAIAALCMEAVGAMAALHELTVDYLKVRKQFGVAIGSFQALQHRAVDMYIALEQARSMALYALLMAESDNDTERQKAISSAKVQINRSARFIGQQAIQLHGGIGMTTEYQAGHYFKRLTMIETQLGDTGYHASRMEGAE
jgi:alkylation response protein AidB-like acyl-CoA dehydrogenase